MSEEEVAPNPNVPITPTGYLFVRLWTTGIILLYAIGGYFGARALRGYTEETEKLRADFLASVTLDPGKPKLESAVLNERPVVKIGLFVNRISDASAREEPWTADFDVGFHWTDPELDPGETFNVVNGDIDSREKIEEGVEGADHYARYAVKAHLQSFFDPTRFPFGDDALVIQIEDRNRAGRAGRYVVEERESGFSRFGVPRHQTIIRSAATVKYYAEESRGGDVPGTPPLRSRFIFAMLRAPPGWMLHVKNSQALFASVAIAFVAFFIKPSWGDGRFGAGVGAIFAAIASNVAAGSAIPTVHNFTLTAFVNAVGLVTIFITLVASTVSLYIFDTLAAYRLCRLFDHASFVACLVGYTAVNILLPYAAMPLTSGGP